MLGIQQVTKKKRTLAWCFAFLALLPLLTFKYYNFLNDSISSGLALICLDFKLPGLNWAIPVGISFFTFQAVGYMLDVYHKRIEPEKNIIDYVLFVSFFPQVTSGPISKADELLPQIKKQHSFSYEQTRDGLKMILWGMFLKCVVADRLGLSDYVMIVSGNNPCTQILDMTGKTVGQEKMTDFIKRELPNVNLETVQPSNLFYPFARLKDLIVYHEEFIGELYALAPDFNIENQ